MYKKYWGNNSLISIVQKSRHYFNSYFNIGKFPDFILAGVQKSGSTSVFRQLINHPEIAKPLKKEIHFFDRFYQNKVKWYKSFFNSKNEKLNFEATPSYFYYPDTSLRINNENIPIKVIVILRNPIHRAISHYEMLKRRGIEKNLNIVSAFENDFKKTKIELKRINSMPSYISNYLLKFGYLARGEYDVIYNEWASNIGKKNILLLQFEDLMKEPAQFYNQITDFLKISRHNFSFKKNYNPGKYNKIIENNVLEYLIKYYKPHVLNLNRIQNKFFKWENF